MSKTISQRQHAVKSAEPARRTPAGDAFTTLIDQVVRLIRLLTIAGDALAKPAGQTLARWEVLEAIGDAPASVAQIARVLGLKRQSVQRVADVLEEEGLTSYEANPSHRRAKLVRLTPHGRSALRKIQAAQRTWS